MSSAAGAHETERRFNTPLSHAVEDQVCADTGNAEQRELAELRSKELMLSSSLAAIASTDRQWRITYVNPMFVKLWGHREAAEVAGRHMGEFSADLSAMVTAIDGLLATGGWQGELLAQRKDGARFWVQVAASTLTDPTGGVIGMTASFVDVTDRRAAELAVREHEQAMQGLLNAIRDSVYLMEIDGAVVYANATVAERLQTTPAAMIGRPIYNFLSPTVGAHRRRQVEEIRRTRQPISFVDQRDNRWIENSLYPICDEQGEVYRLAVYGRDVTEQRRAEEALRQREHEYRALVENSPDIVARFDPDLRHLFVNRAVELVTGMPAASMIGKSDRELGMPAEQVATWEHYIKRVFATGQPEEIEFEFPSPTGQQYFHSRVLPEYGENGEVESVLGVTHNITERKRMEITLRASEERLRKIIETAQEGIWLIDAEAYTTYVNPAMAAMLGYTADEMNGRHLFEFMDEEAKQSAIYNLERRRHGIVERHDFRFRRKDGSDLWALLSTNPFLDDAGGFLGALAMVADISERIQAEAALRASETRFRATFEQAAVGVALLAPDRRWLRVNQRLCDIVGYTEDELLTKTAEEITHPDDQARDQVRVQQLLKGEIPTYTLEKRYLHKLGSIVWIDLTVALVRTAAGAPEYLIAVIQDITGRKQIEDALAKREAQFRGVVAAMTEGVVMHETSGKIILANASAERILGLNYDQLVGRTSFDPRWQSIREDGAPFPGETHPAMVALRTGMPQTNVIMGVHKPDGKLTWISINAQPLLEPGAPEPYAVVATFHDITERKQAEARLLAAMNELTRSNRDLEQFAYVVAHDLQEPLRMVAAFVQLLAQNYRGRLDADADEYIGYAVDGAKRMQQLTADLLAYSRVSTRGKEFAPVDCATIVQSVLQSLQLTIEETGAVVTCAPLPLVLGDAAQIYQVFQNLVANALKYRSSAPPRITIDWTPTTGTTGHEGCFSVTDNGIGIEPQYFERIFVVFQRLHTRAEYPGTGIGLAICKKIVERHGGRIWVESRAGAGATFYFTLPRAD